MENNGWQMVDGSKSATLLRWCHNGYYLTTILLCQYHFLPFDVGQLNRSTNHHNLPKWTIPIDATFVGQPCGLGVH